MEKLEADYNIFDWWKKVFIKNYANFNGRARRAEYWYYSLANFILIVCLGVLSSFGGEFFGEEIFSWVGLVLVVFYLSLVIPTLAVIVRRLHDINKSGWSFFIYFIPFVGTIILLVWLFTDGNRFANNYGYDPKNFQSTPEFDFEKTSDGNS